MPVYFALRTEVVTMFNRYLRAGLCATLGLFLVSAQGYAVNNEPNSVGKLQLASVPGPPIPDPWLELASVPGPPIPDPWLELASVPGPPIPDPWFENSKILLQPA